MASLSRTVHLRSPEQVVQAYENWAVPHFALFNNKQLLFAYDNDTGDISEGSQLLNDWVNILYNSGSAGIYTLCIYKDLKNKSIDSKTAYNGSINFQFHEYKYPSMPGGNGGTDPNLKLILDEMASMKLAITKLQEEGEPGDDDDNDNILAGVTTLLNNPVIAGLLGSLIPKPGSVQRLPGATMEPVSEPGKVSRIAGAPAGQDNDQLLAASLAQLKAAVPNLPEVLAQLAKLHEKRPFQFKAYMNMLMAMKL